VGYRNDPIPRISEVGVSQDGSAYVKHPSIVRFHVHTVPFYPAYFVFRAFRHSETLSTAAGLLATAIDSGTSLTTFRTSSW
jgi:hypothetical protein